MSTLPGTSCLLTDPDDLIIPSPRTSGTERRPRWTATPADPGDDAARARLAATIGRGGETCCTCGVPLSEMFTRRAKSGKTFCHICAEHVVAAYLARHPEARRPRQAEPVRERTGTAYLQERERYQVRYHAGNARWQISDTQVQRWTSHVHPTEPEATADANAMNAAWRDQIALERRTPQSPIFPSTSPRHTWRVGERGYGREEV